MNKITKEMDWLVDAYTREISQPAPQDVAKIKLSQLVSKLGFFYEKLRNVVDYNEEHMVRRNSLERLLKRQIFFLQEKNAAKISQTIIYEFIRAKYLPNDTLPETFIEQLARTIEKYLFILSYLHGHAAAENQKLSVWVIGLAACEINEQLSPAESEKEAAMARLMYSHLVEQIAFTKNNLPEKEKNLQIYIAVLRTLFKADAVALRYQLLKLHVPNWEHIRQEELSGLLPRLGLIRYQIERGLNHQLAFQLTRTVRPQAVFFSILKEIMEKNSSDLKNLISQPELLKEKITEVTNANYQKIHSRLIGTIIRVIIYILLTKTILAFILELPFDYFILQKINWQALTINVVFHPLLMFFIAMTIKVPGAKNTQIIVEEIQKIVYGEKRKIIFKPKSLMKRGSTGYFVFNTIYLAMFLLIFGIIINTLKWLHFNLVSGVLFIFFLCVVSFFGFRLRHFAKQFSVMPRSDNFFNFIIDFVSLPIVRVGRFFSTNFSKINIFLFILDFIIETPFKMLVEFLEKAVSFIKEKREEIVE